MKTYNEHITQVACYYSMECFNQYSEFFEEGYEEYNIYNSAIEFAQKYTHLIIPNHDSDFDRDLFDKLLKMSVIDGKVYQITTFDMIDSGDKFKIISDKHNNEFIKVYDGKGDLICRNAVTKHDFNIRAVNLFTGAVWDIKSDDLVEVI